MKYKLSDVVDRINGNVDRFTTSLEYYVGGEHFESNELEITGCGLIKPNVNILGFKFHFAFQPGDVLYMARNPHLRKAGMVNFSGICSDASYILRTKDSNVLCQEYLAVIMQSNHLWDYCESHKVGSVNFAINWKTLANYEFDLPDINIQRSIANRIWAAYRVKQAYKKLISATDEMVKSQFIEMFDFHELNLNSPSKDFESMCLDDTSSATKIPAAEYLQEGKYAVYDQAQEKDIAGYSNTEQGLCRNYPAVLFGDHSRVVKYINEPFFIGADGVKIIRPRKDNLIPEFLYYDLKYHNIPNTGYNRHFKYIKMISLTKASLEEQSQFLSIAHQADKSGFDGRKSQFIEMFKHKKPNGKIADLVDANIKSVKKSFNKEDMIEYIDISSVNAKYRTLNEATQYIVASAPSRAQQCVQNGDILVSTVRPINRNVAVVNSNLTNLVASTGFCVLRPIDGYREYLLAIVTSDKYTGKMCDIASGGLYPAVNNGDVLSYDIFIPDKDFLNRITQICRQGDKSGSVLLYRIAC